MISQSIHKQYKYAAYIYKAKHFKIIYSSFPSMYLYMAVYVCVILEIKTGPCGSFIYC